MDLVFVDAPCTGSGTWRRHPDTKWRVTPEQLAKRMAEQDAVLGDAVTFAKPGGRIVYVTCSLLAEENEDRIVAVINNNSCVSVTFQQRLTPWLDGCDAFFAADLLKS